MPDEPEEIPEAEPEAETEPGSAPEEAEVTPEATPEVTPEAGPSSEGSFDVDPALEAAMREAEASYERRHGEEHGEEVEIETEASAAPAAGASEGVIRALGEMRKARDELEIAEEKNKDLEDRLMRTTADFENYKKRMTRERDDEKKFAVEKLLKDLLPVLDNMERAMDAAREAGHEQIVSGVEMVHKQFLETLGRYGVEQFSAKGQKFDPNFHEAMQEMETTEVPPGHVAMEFMRGYTLHGRLVRPAMVVVAKAPAGAPAPAPEADPPAADAAEADPPPAAAEASPEADPTKAEAAAPDGDEGG